MTTGSAQSLPWTLVVPIPSTTPGRFSLSRRTLYRALAVVVALAAITPLFAEADADSPRGNPQLQGADPQTD
ncbi:MAG: hypothetical protein HXX12_12760 [Geothrix sp.]|uniref:hypothetical protein n=1 Tax=Geothrix sp. TaxID=1962974 RepID=UPI001851E7A9|nr:hypothetical protein [Geothrix sp.]NWJ41826.1 hypothetical protein [Geothrix sp.]WIL20198.1 MAG: hypothetical protein QOZ81_002747 [Geothrix sp.]